MPSVAFADTDMSYCDSTDDSVRKVTDDFGRHRLTDVLEEENEEEPSGRTSSLSLNRKRYSSIGSTASSMDGLWETHPRRLSEAGLSRHSDSSAVLTEDTDSFIIGERVWVSGTKPGHIAYIGETQFAPGDWAGIALDEPIGKNDGSVGGIHYFQCEPKKGVFARLTRLTRVPLLQENMGSTDTYIASTPVNNGVRRSPISPTGSTKSLLKSPVSISGSNTSLTSTASHVIDYKIGDRVIIKSSQGSKVGTVRFIGTTEFATGEWVGVELDDPRGKNDGSVNGKRYFDCRPNFGLFAPVSKVSKSPSRIKPGACIVHSGAGLPPSGLKRTNSKESMLSNLSMSSAASHVRRKSPTKPTTTPLPTRTALQDVLKEKQQHIEQLLKERDLERAEVTRASSQADEAEQKLATLRQEYEKYRSECDVKLQEHMNLLNKLKEDRNDLLAQLEDEKRKNEDLLFRLEEASITKDDIEVTNESHLIKIKELEEQLSRERDKIDNFEADANKLFEAEESLIKAKEEIESLREQLSEARTRQISLEGDSASTAVLIASLQKEADQYKKDLEERNEMISILKQETSKISSDLKKHLVESSNERLEAESLCAQKDNELTSLKAELEQVTKLVQEKMKALETVTEEKLSSETSSEKEITRLKMELSAKILDLETATENIKEKESVVNALETQIDALRKDLETRNKDLEQYQNNLSNVEANLRTELEALREQLKQKIIENGEIKEDLSNQLVDRDKKIEENNNTIMVNFEEITRLKTDLEIAKKSLETTSVDLQEKFRRQIEDKENQLNNLKTELEQRNKEISENLNVSNNFKMQYESKSAELENLKLQFESTQKELENTLNSKSMELHKISDYLKERENLIQTLQTELQTTKVDLESVSNNLIQYQTNLNDVEANLKKERDEIKDTLKTKIVEFEDAKKEFAEKLTQKEKQLEEITIACNRKTEEVEKLLKEINDLKEAQDKSAKDINEVHDKEIKQRDQKIVILSEEIERKNEEVINISSKISQLEDCVKEKDTTISSLHKDIEFKNKELESQSQTGSMLQEEIALLVKNKEELSSKNTELEKIRVDLQNVKQIKENDIVALNNELQANAENITHKEEKIKSLEEELNIVKGNLEKTSSDLLQYQSNLSDVESNLKKERDDIRSSLEIKSKELEQIKQELTEKVFQAQIKLEDATGIIAEKTSEIEKLTGKIADLTAENDKKLKEISEKHKKATDDLEIKISDFLTEIENKNLELAKQSDSVSKLEEVVTGKGKEVEKLQAELEVTQRQHLTGNENILKLNDQIQVLQTSNEELKKQLADTHNQIEDISSQKHKLEDDIKTLSTSVGDVSTKLQELNKQLEDKDKILATTKSELEAKLRSVEDTLKQIEGKNNDLKAAMEKQKLEYEEKLKFAAESEEVLKDALANADKDTQRAKELEKNLENAKSSLVEKEKQISSQSKEISKLKEDLNKVQLPQNNLNGKVDAPTPNLAETNSNTDYKQLLEEKLFAESQVAFLNSIIVDMQKKNEEQKARIEILEMGYNSAAADELAQLGFHADRRQPAPRMYCDICEEFDLHETEDCPTQGDDEPMPVNPHLGEPKEKPPPRPYCENCGVFGHATEDCTEDQEF